MSRTIVLLAASLVALPAAGLAQPSEPISVTAQRDQAVVSYADLDIASAAGKRMLDHRVSGAIEQVCGSFANVRE